MKTKKNQSETFEEIIFSARNKAYGAYFLRSTYTRTVATAAAITLFIFSAAVSWALWSSKARTIERPLRTIYEIDSARIIRMDPPPEPPPEAPLPETSRQLFRPVVVDSAVDNTLASQDDLAGINNPPPGTMTEPVRTDTAGPPPEPITPSEAPPPLLVVQEMPEFPGGEQERIRFMKEHLVYPAEARETGISGTVFLGFIVEPDGSITSLKVLRGIGGGCEEEALRVIMMMPKWKPGMQQGHEVRVQFTLPVKFTLQ